MTGAGSGPPPFFVLTGGPGSGKTSIIEALKGAGHLCAPEAGRGIIQDQSAIGGSALPWADKAAFAELMLCWDIRSHRAAAAECGPVFFDRGIPDIVGYLRLEGLAVPDHMIRAAEVFRYASPVFIAPPWPEIYRQDVERRQGLDVARRTCEAMVSAYGELGYELVELPRVSVAERMVFILDRCTPTFFRSAGEGALRMQGG